MGNMPAQHLLLHPWFQPWSTCSHTCSLKVPALAQAYLSYSSLCQACVSSPNRKSLLQLVASHWKVVQCTRAIIKQHICHQNTYSRRENIKYSTQGLVYLSYPAMYIVIYVNNQNTPHDSQHYCVAKKKNTIYLQFCCQIHWIPMVSTTFLPDKWQDCLDVQRISEK